jgi:hypothetical protein
LFEFFIKQKLKERGCWVMITKCGDCRKGAGFLMVLSIIALALSALVSLFQMDLWLAGTQWILIAILLALYSLIFSVGCFGGKNESEK